MRTHHHQKKNVVGRRREGKGWHRLRHSPPSAAKRLRRTALEDSLSSEEEYPFAAERLRMTLFPFNFEGKLNKMDYCAARRRKVMAEKEMGHHSWQQPLKKAGGISDNLLTNLEEKYGNQRKKKKKKEEEKKKKGL